MKLLVFPMLVFLSLQTVAEPLAPFSKYLGSWTFESNKFSSTLEINEVRKGQFLIKSVIKTSDKKIIDTFFVSRFRGINLLEIRHEPEEKHRFKLNASYTRYTQAPSDRETYNFIRLKTPLEVSKEGNKYDIISFVFSGNQVTLSSASRSCKPGPLNREICAEFERVGAINKISYSKL